ncbi:hypothetical protein JCM18901_1672 [Psychrobacter sp. JCM 18901]|uniref:hypothetical protein n=1 Tax=Psychrobacter sp. JCM 18901 TaxID=1298609 RepID=UPI00043229CB|nr:hypothetical protein [Psychrobacter sp. JCM 18901]GAF55981.1 hypothetical protein JCM18901_1672 [Psychrobacter sp. JCM 18901]
MNLGLASTQELVGTISPIFLGVSNNLPQLVSLDIRGSDEDLQITYEDTKNLMFNQNMIRVLTTSIFGFGFIFFYDKT